MMRIACFVVAGVFLLGAVVQWNDPDPALWILGYLVGAALSLHAGLGYRAFLPNAIAALVFGVWGATLVTPLLDAPVDAFTSFRMESDSHEEPREAVGLALLSGWCVFLSLRARPESEREDA
jgi:hypothetical protein